MHEVKDSAHSWWRGCSLPRTPVSRSSWSRGCVPCCLEWRSFQSRWLSPGEATPLAPPTDSTPFSPSIEWYPSVSSSLPSSPPSPNPTHPPIWVGSVPFPFHSRWNGTETVSRGNRSDPALVGGSGLPLSGADSASSSPLHSPPQWLSVQLDGG